jgi:hypothetical protein
MKEAYLSLRRLVQLSNQVLDFPFTNRTPADIVACENALLCLCAELANYRANYSGMEFELGKAAIRALGSASFAARLIGLGPHLHQFLENWREGVVLAEPLLYGASGKHNLFAATRKPLYAMRSPNPKFLDHLDDAYQVWLARQTVEPKGASGAQIEAPVVPKKSETEKAAVRRNKLQESRDKWIYEQCRKGIPHDKIAADLRKRAFEKGWKIVSTKQRIHQIGNNYADAHGLERPDPRKNL